MIYDFSDWESGDFDKGDELVALLKSHVIENLRAAFAQFANGSWESYNDDNPSVVWENKLEEDECCYTISLTPVQFQECMTRRLRMQYPSDLHPRSEHHRDALREDLAKIMTPWRAALDAIDAEGKRLLDAPIH